MVDGPRNLPSKKDVVLALLKGPSVFVHLDPRKKGVVVPLNFRKQPQLVLQIGLNMAVQIPDLRVDDEGITCTLSFSRSPFWCALPWSAIYALVSEDGPGMVWPDDVPPEVAAQMQAAVTKQQPKRPRPKLSAVAPPSETDPTPSSERAEAKAEAEPKQAQLEEAEPTPPEEAPQPSRDDNVVPIRPLAKKDKETEEAPSEPEETPKPPPQRGTSGKKPRRELPPYLRIIK